MERNDFSLEIVATFNSVNFNIQFKIEVPNKNEGLNFSVLPFRLEKGISTIICNQNRVILTILFKDSQFPARSKKYFRELRTSRFKQMFYESWLFEWSHEKAKQSFCLEWMQR